MSSTKPIFISLDLEVDANQHRLLKGGAALAVRPKTFRLLLVFLAHPGQILTKAYLLEQVWEGAVVEEQTLFQSISELRKLCGEREVIRNYPQKGYAWTPEVLCQSIKPPSWRGRLPALTGRRAMLAGLIVMILFLGASWRLMGLIGDNQAPVITSPVIASKGSLVVLPIDNHLADSHYRWLRLGAMDLLIQQLKDALDFPVMHTEDVLERLPRAQADPAMAIDGQVIDHLFHTSGAAYIVQLSIMGTPAEYELLYQLHTPTNSRRGALISPTLEGGLATLAALIIQDFQPNSPKTRSDYASAFADELLAKGLEHLRAGELDKAISYLHSALADHPENPLPRRLLGEAFYQQGERARAQQEFQTALEFAQSKFVAPELSSSASTSSELPRLLYWLARCALDENDYTTALELGHAAVISAKKHHDWLYRAYSQQILAEVFVAQGHLSKAHQALELALADHSALNCPEGQAVVLLQMVNRLGAELPAELAEQHVVRALRLAEGAQLKGLQLDAWLARATRHAQNAQLPEAQAALVQAQKLAAKDAQLAARLAQFELTLSIPNLKNAL